MKICVINPNTSASMTQHIRRELETIKRADTELTVMNPEHGPEAIECARDEVMAGPALLELVARANAEGYDAIVLACFSDPALDAAREISDILVIGIEEATLHVACMLGHKFSVLTSLPRRIPTRELHARLRGVETAFASAPVLDMPVLDMDARPEIARARALALARKAIAEDGAEVIILGCAGLTGYARDIERELGAVVLDPTAIAFKLAEAFVDLGLRQSKVRRFAAPAPRQFE
jgi:allantoin racemase